MGGLADHLTSMAVGVLIKENLQVPRIPRGGGIAQFDLDRGIVSVLFDDPIHFRSVWIPPEANRDLVLR